MTLIVKKSAVDFSEYEIAVVDVDANGEPISTPFRIKRNESVICKAFDSELNEYVECEITMTGSGHVVAVDIDEKSEFYGMSWTVDVEQLATPKYQFIR